MIFGWPEKCVECLLFLLLCSPAPATKDGLLRTGDGADLSAPEPDKDPLLSAMLAGASALAPLPFRG